MLMVQKQSSANTVDVGRRFKNLAWRVSKRFPRESVMRSWILRRISLTVDNHGTVITGGILVIFVILLFLRDFWVVFYGDYYSSS